MSQDKEWTAREIKKEVKEGKILVILFGGVYDLTQYIDKHPGGKKIIKSNIGKDATEKFVAAGHLTKSRVV